jgi:hypothetical protein
MAIFCAQFGPRVCLGVAYYELDLVDNLFNVGLYLVLRYGRIPASDSQPSWNLGTINDLLPYALERILTPDSQNGFLEFTNAQRRYQRNWSYTHGSNILHPVEVLHKTLDVLSVRPHQCMLIYDTH